jgi:phage terminase large subunit-like protein
MATATRASKSSGKRRGAGSGEPVLQPTLGPQVCRWIERNLVHAEGDYFGKPFALRPWQRAFIWRAYELKADGSRRYSRALLGLPKGNGKTELAAAIGCAELGGPVVFSHWGSSGSPVGTRRTSPDIPVAAASFDQADLIFGAARTMIKEGPLAEFFEVFDVEIQIKGGPGRMYRVAAVAGPNDGLRPTFFLADELHEWVGPKERVHLVLSNGRAKRVDSWELGISTAGWDVRSLLGRMYSHGKRVLSGEDEDDSLLFEWHEPSADVALDDGPALEAVIREANPAADDFLSVAQVVARAKEIPEFEFRRYHLNQWVDSPEMWLPHGMWDARADTSRGFPPDGTSIVIGFDGSYSGDSTGLVGATVEDKPYLFVIGAWEKGRQEDWRVPIAEVEDVIRQSCQRWQVQTIGMDPHRWGRTLQQLQDEGFPAVEWNTAIAGRMVPACAQFYDAVSGSRLTHDGGERLATHIAQSVVRIDARGVRISKDHKDSERHIDLAVCAVIAHDCAVRAGAGAAWSVADFSLSGE